MKYFVVFFSGITLTRYFQISSSYNVCPTDRMFMVIVGKVPISGGCGFDNQTRTPAFLYSPTEDYVYMENNGKYNIFRPSFTSEKSRRIVKSQKCSLLFSQLLQLKEFSAKFLENFGYFCTVAEILAPHCMTSSYSTVYLSIVVGVSSNVLSMS